MLKRTILIFAATLVIFAVTYVFSYIQVAKPSRQNIVEIHYNENVNSICINTKLPNYVIVPDQLTVKLVLNGETISPTHLQVTRNLNSDPDFGPFISWDYRYDRVCTHNFNLNFGENSLSYYISYNFFAYEGGSTTIVSKEVE